MGWVQDEYSAGIDKTGMGRVRPTPIPIPILAISIIYSFFLFSLPIPIPIGEGFVGFMRAQIFLSALVGHSRGRWPRWKICHERRFRLGGKDSGIGGKNCS